MPPFLLSLISGVSGYLAAAAVAALGAVAATHYVDAAVYGKTIATQQEQYANQKAANATAALSQLTGFINKANAAQLAYQGDMQNINAQFNALQEGLKHATAKPLPRDCKPDAERVRSLADAIAAANAANPAASK